MDGSNDADLIIKLNVGGTKFQCYLKTLKVFSESKLAELNNTSKVYFFDRNPVLFGNILDGCRKGFIHISKDICGATFREELAFWEISPTRVAPCCLETLYSSDGDADNMIKLMRSMCLKDNRNTGRQNGKLSLRQKVWEIMDEPGSSKWALLWCIFMSMLISISLVVTILYTLPQFCFTHESEQLTTMIRILKQGGYTEKSLNVLCHLNPKDKFYCLDLVCHTILSLELVVSFILCPNKITYAKCFVRILVLIGYLAFWAGLIAEPHVLKFQSMHLVRAFIAIKYLTVLKILRMFYIVRNISAFKVMKLTFMTSVTELRTLALVLVIFVCLFGFCMYLAEMSVNNDITNALAGMYWALITVTTVGYGDFIPVTPLGHVIASVCAVCGVLVLALPIGVIASKFYTFYNYHQYAAKYLTAHRLYSDYAGKEKYQVK